LSNLFLNIFDDGVSTTSLFSTYEIKQQVPKNFEIFSGLLIALKMNSDFNLPVDLTGSSPSCGADKSLIETFMEREI